MAPESSYEYVLVCVLCVCARARAGTGKVEGKRIELISKEQVAL